MKVGELAKRRGENRLSPLKRRVLEYLESRSGEVFSYRDEELTRALGVKRSALDFTLWALHRDGLIDKQEVDGKVYFGSHGAIGDLRSRLGIAQPQDPFARARAVRDRIAARTGAIDVIELLDAVRGPWD